MEEQKEQTNETVNLEQLLKLKRFEQPEDHFWDGFEKKLHQRMLSTLIEQASLRTRFTRRMSKIVHSAYALPAAAMFVMAFYAVPAFYTGIASNMSKSNNHVAMDHEALDAAIVSTASFTVEDIQQTMSTNNFSIELPNNDISADMKNVEFFSSTVMPYRAEQYAGSNTLY